MADSFFTHEDTQDAIKTFAEAETVVLFVGAGVSSSQGLPTWRELLRDLLVATADRDGRLNPQDLQDSYIRALFQTYDNTYLGSLARKPHGHRADALRDALRGELYRPRHEDTGRRGVGPNFVAAVCQFILTRKIAGKETLILTTNYDDVLETSFQYDNGIRSMFDEAGFRDVQTCVDLPSSKDPDLLRIFHLHGFVPREKKDDIDSELVLSARDYGAPWEDHWSFKILNNYWDSSWLFVGISFADPHITTYLTVRDLRHSRAEPARPRSKAVGVFSLQARSWAALPSELRPPLIDAEIDRFAEVGMTALPTDYYFQDAQFLREVCLLLAENLDEVPEEYTQRLALWEKAFLASRLPSDDSCRVTQFSHDVSEMLLDIRTETEALAIRRRSESFKVELWARDIANHALFQIGSSEFIHRDPRRARRFPLTSKSAATAAVAAFTIGNRVTMPSPVDLVHDRWKSFCAVPIYLPSEPWYGLPVGALMIASTYPVTKPKSTLVANDSELRNKFESWLPRVCQSLDPESVFVHPSI